VRRIRKRSEPRELTEWRASAQADPNQAGINFGYDALRQNANAITAVTDALLAEQGWLCAYTGRRIDFEQTHIEHLIPQVHCQHGQDVDYVNLVACWPGPNNPNEPAYGARRKGSWPDNKQRPLFVSPLSANCEDRFSFNIRGEITAATANDAAATETIIRLNLTDPELTRLRKDSIVGALSPRGLLTAPETRKLLRELDRDEAELNGGSKLTPYCFAVRQAARRHLDRLEAIRQHQ